MELAKLSDAYYNSGKFNYLNESHRWTKILSYRTSYILGRINIQDEVIAIGKECFDNPDLLNHTTTIIRKSILENLHLEQAIDFVVGKIGNPYCAASRRKEYSSILKDQLISIGRVRVRN